MTLTFFSRCGEISATEFVCGNNAPGRCAWQLDDVRAVTQGIF